MGPTVRYRWRMIIYRGRMRISRGWTISRVRNPHMTCDIIIRIYSFQFAVCSDDEQIMRQRRRPPLPPVSRIDSSARNDSTALLFVMIGWISVELWPVCCVFGIRTVSGGDIMVDGHQK